MKPRHIYIAGPMTGYPEWNFPAFDAAAGQLRADGHDVISPAELDRAAGFNETGMAGTEKLDVSLLREFARRDISAILQVDEVRVLPGWEQSAGARHEVQIAGFLGIPVFTLEGQVIPSEKEWSGAPNERASCLREAERLVNGDRNAQYGDPRQDFKRTATMWSAYLGTQVAPHDVAALMALLKLSRIRWSPTKRDSWVDLAGYAACGWDCAAEEVTP